MFIFTYFGSYVATLKNFGQYKIKMFPIRRNVNKCWRKISRRLVKKQLCRPSQILNCHQNVIRLMSYIYFIYLGFVKCYMITYFSVMLQNNYFLEYFIFYIRLLPTEKAVQRCPAKKCLKGFPKIKQKTGVFVYIFRTYRKTFLQNTCEKSCFCTSSGQIF